MTMQDILRTAFLTPMGDLFTMDSDEQAWGLPLVAIGPPGAGKTSTMYALARQYGVPCEPVKPGSRGEGQFGVVPVPTIIDGKTYLDFPPPARLSRKFGTGAGLMFVDELNTAPMSIMPALLALVQERELGDWRMPPRVRAFGAMNRPDDAPDARDLAPAMANRIIHIEWPDPDVKAWRRWLLSGAHRETAEPIDLLAEEKKVLDAWPVAWASEAGKLDGFFQGRPTNLRMQPKAEDPGASGPWASPRTNEYVARILTAGKIQNCPQEDIETLVRGAIGSAANELFNWIRKQDLPRPEDVLDGRVKFEHSPARLDRTCAILSACTGVVMDTGCDHRDARAKALFEMCKKISETSPDLAAPSVFDLVVKGRLIPMNEARELLTLLEPVIHA